MKKVSLGQFRLVQPTDQKQALSSFPFCSMFSELIVINYKIKILQLVFSYKNRGLTNLKKNCCSESYRAQLASTSTSFIQKTVRKQSPQPKLQRFFCYNQILLSGKKSWLTTRCYLHAASYRSYTSRNVLRRTYESL